jgi:hypothetical protein
MVLSGAIGNLRSKMKRILLQFTARKRNGLGFEIRALSLACSDMPETLKSRFGREFVARALGVYMVGGASRDGEAAWVADE